MQNDLISRSRLTSSIAREDTRYIGGVHYIRLSAVQEKIKIAPSVDAVEVVRCRKCKESEQLSVLDTDFLYCGVWDTAVHCNGYCYHGAKMDGGAAK